MYYIYHIVVATECVSHDSNFYCKIFNLLRICTYFIRKIIKLSNKSNNDGKKEKLKKIAHHRQLMYVF